MELIEEDVVGGSDAVFCGAGGIVGNVIGGNPLTLVAFAGAQATPPGPTTITVGLPSAPVVVTVVVLVNVLN